MSEDSVGEDSPGVETVGWRSVGRDQLTLGSSLLGLALCMRVPEAHPALTRHVVQQRVIGVDDDCEGGEDREADDRAQLADHVLDLLIDLDQAKGGLDLRLARTLAWTRHEDLSTTGWTTWSAWCSDQVSLSDTRLRQLVRLADSDLDRVKTALSQNRIPLDVALLAPGQTNAADQDAWLVRALSGDVRPARPARSAAADVELTGDDVKLVHAARTRARLVLGHPASDEATDRFILETWRTRRAGSDVIAEARAPRPAPSPDPPRWCDEADPATPLLGPWCDPRDLDDAGRQIRVLSGFRSDRTLLMGVLYDVIAEDCLYRDCGFDTLAAMVRGSLSVSKRTLERYRAHALTLTQHPQLVAAMLDGLGVDHALLVGRIATHDTLEEWLDIAERTGKSELRRAVTMASQAPAGDVRAAYKRAMETAPRATDRISLAAAFRPPRAPRYTTAHPDLLTAAQWFLDEVQIDRQYGFGRVKERDWWTCRNPDCGRRTLRSDAHHVIPRSQGGLDDLDENGLCLCKACHLRGVHAGGRIQVQRVGDGWLWTYADGRRVWQV